MKQWTGWLLLIASLACAPSCGTVKRDDECGAGLDCGDEIRDLTDQDRRDFCIWAMNEVRDPDDYCVGNWPFEDVENCIWLVEGYGGCGLTVGEVDSCFWVIQSNLCGDWAGESECVSLAACYDAY